MSIMFITSNHSVNKMPPYIDPMRLLIKNFPIDFTGRDICEFLQMLGATDVKLVGRKSVAIANFKNECETKNILNFLHQHPINNSMLRVEYARNNVHSVAEHMPPYAETLVPSTSGTSLKLNKFIQGCSEKNGYDFDKPPPPYLKYHYPKLNRDILDAICIALETSPKFYTQVLHLMNRMNMEPPFIPGAKNISHKVGHDVACQTAEDFSVKTVIDVDLASDEFELESDIDNSPSKLVIFPKRKQITNLHKRTKRIRTLIDSEKKKQQPTEVKYKETNNTIPNIFEFNQLLNIDRTITIVTPEKINHTSTKSIPSTEQSDQVECLIDVQLEDLQSNKIPLNQLRTHPLFQNYLSGKRSNKLYIKNLAKTVTEADLQKIYGRYGKSNSNVKVNESLSETNHFLDIRLMRTGRMKGQAFITFNNPYLSEDNYELIEQARLETNGFILKDKVMVVSFGQKN